MIVLLNLLFFFSSRRRHTRCALVTGVQTCALPICRLGEDVFSPAVTLRQAPHLQRASGSAHHDSEGVATQARTLVDHGRLESWLLSSYSARKLGLQTTGNAGGVFNLVVEPGMLGFDEFLSEMGEGLRVPELLRQGGKPDTHIGRASGGERGGE